MNRVFVLLATAGAVVSLLGTTAAAQDEVVAVPTGDCLTLSNPCETVPIQFNRTNTSGARGISVTFTLSPELELCVNAATSIDQGTWLNGFATTFQVVDHLDGSYTVDQLILGSPCGVTIGGTLFTIDVAASGGDGTGTITINSVLVRDCVNQPLPGSPGSAASIVIDTVNPSAVANLSSTQIKTANDTDGTTDVQVNFTAPGDAAVVEVYRAPFCNGSGINTYPEYNDVAGAGPPPVPSYPPSAPWALTSVTADGQLDETAARGFWYYVVFTKDACGNVSSVSNLTSGSLNYHLGDVTNGSTNGTGDNDVNFQDVGHLGGHYGISLVLNDPVNYLDVGPTTNMTVDGRPTTDNLVNFEDLVMFAINYGTVGRIPEEPSDIALDDPALILDIDRSTVSQNGILTARLVLEGNTRTVKALHSVIQFDSKKLELISVSQGDWISGQGTVFFKDLRSEKNVTVDAALLGSGLVFDGSGEVATLTFRASADGEPRLMVSDLRDRNNQPAGHAGSNNNDATSARAGADGLRVLGARPNPFAASTDISFEIARTSEVSLRIYDVVGRLVRTLVDQPMEAGQHHVMWEGRSDQGRPLGAGIYFYRLEAGNLQETHRLLHVR